MATVIPLRHRAARLDDQQRQQQAEEFDPNCFVLEIQFTPEAQLCMSTVKQRRALTLDEQAHVKTSLRRLQEMLLAKHNELTRAGCAPETGGLTGL